MRRAEAALRDEGGLTLLELLISMAILGLIFLIIGSALQISYRAIRTGDTHIERVHRARVLTEQIAQELRSAYRFAKLRTTEELVTFRGGPDGMSLVATTAIHARGLTTSGLKEVTFAVEEEASTGRRGLVLREDIIPHGDLFEAGKGYQTMLDPTVAALRCRYFGPPEAAGAETLQPDQWHERWEREELPRAVEVTLVFQEEDRGPRIEVPPITLVLPIELAFEMVNR